MYGIQNTVTTGRSGTTFCVEIHNYTCVTLTRCFIMVGVCSLGPLVWIICWENLSWDFRCVAEDLYHKMCNL